MPWPPSATPARKSSWCPPAPSPPAWPRLGLAKRPRDLATQQAAASVGQGLLMARYTQAFGAHGVTVSQVLLTADDLMRRSHHTNAFRALNRLLNLGVVPVVNENDTVATHEIRFGDNDRLAALVAHLVRADALVLLSDVDSLYDGPPSQGRQADSRAWTAPQDLEGVSIGSARQGRRGHRRNADQGRGGHHGRRFRHPRAGHLHGERRRRPGRRGRGNLVHRQRGPQAGPAAVARPPGVRAGHGSSSTTAP